MRNKLITLLIAAVAATIFAAPAGASMIINLDGRSNAGDDAAEIQNKGVSRHLLAGTYRVTFVRDGYTAFNRWSRHSDCDGSGENCRTGWENSARILLGLGGTELTLGIGGGYGPIPGWNGYFKTDDMSFNNAGGYSQTFSLSAPEDVYFYIRDNQLNDNAGGVSLQLVSVPAPAGWLLSVAGLGLIGLLLVHRRKTGTPMAS